MEQQSTQISSIENSTSNLLKQVANQYSNSKKASQGFGYIAASKYLKKYL
jgi:hypothetical protein